MHRSNGDQRICETNVDTPRPVMRVVRQADTLTRQAQDLAGGASLRGLRCDGVFATDASPTAAAELASVEAVILHYGGNTPHPCQT